MAGIAERGATDQRARAALWTWDGNEASAPAFDLLDAFNDSIGTASAAAPTVDAIFDAAGTPMVLYPKLESGTPTIVVATWSPGWETKSLAFTTAGGSYFEQLTAMRSRGQVALLGRINNSGGTADDRLLVASATPFSSSGTLGKDAYPDSSNLAAVANVAALPVHDLSQALAPWLVFWSYGTQLFGYGFSDFTSALLPSTDCNTNAWLQMGTKPILNINSGRLPDRGVALVTYSTGVSTGEYRGTLVMTSPEVAQEAAGSNGWPNSSTACASFDGRFPMHATAVPSQRRAPFALTVH